MEQKLSEYTARCPECGTWTSNLEPAINAHKGYAGSSIEIDAPARAAGLQALRRRNFEVILDHLAHERPLPDTRLVDVGSAHGWFLEEAERRGAQAVGVEAETEIAQEAASRGLDIRVGFFPEALADDERFDVITFNDVLEHIPDVKHVLDACAGRLRPGGLLSINIPSTRGLGYRTATLLARLGVRGPFRRFWQEGLPSPHQHYFPPDALVRLLRDHHFEVLTTQPLAAISRRGLWARVHFSRRTSLTSLASFGALYLASPLLNRPALSDIILLIAQRPGQVDTTTSPPPGTAAA